MWAKPPVNLPGKPGIVYPNRPNSKKCPECGRTFMEVDIEKHGDRGVKCPHCGEKIILKIKPNKKR